MINISFEITDCYDTEGFRNTIKLLMSDDNYNVFIISNDDSSALIGKVGQSLGLPTQNIIVCNFTSDKIAAITANKIDIHFDNLQSFILLVDETTDAHGVLVTSNWNGFYNKSDYLVVFDRKLNQVISEKESS